MVPAEQNEQFGFLKCFGNVLVRWGHGDRVNVHACRFEIWRLDGLQAFPKTSGNLQDTGKNDCEFRVDASLARSATLSF